MVDTANITQVIEPALVAMGYRLVRVVVTSGREARLQIMAERADEAPMSVEDCAAISRALSPLLDVADPIAGTYTLEVSSPGIERPLTRPEDYDRFAGRAAKIELARAIDGRKRFRGRLNGTADGTIRLVLDEAEVRLPLSVVARAKLIIEDVPATPARKKSGASRPRPSPTRSQIH
ncbi:MAG TPA: ribosome maturation factor RimP [Stellaceae bacterium]|nr:ribosome maturation factor RimP [Stellaceae bacterium]